jgi:hypothetical protein
VELADQIRELATKTLRAEYRKVQPEDARVLLFDGGQAPLAVFGDKLEKRASLATCPASPKSRCSPASAQAAGSADSSPGKHGTAIQVPRSRLGGLHRPWSRARLGRPAPAIWPAGLVCLALVHIAFLTGFRNRLGALVTWWVAFIRDIRKERAYTTRAAGIVQDVYQPVFSPPSPRGPEQGQFRAGRLPGGN